MKYFSFILVFYLCLLTIAPAFVKLIPCAGIQTEALCKNSCTKSSADCKDSNKKQNDDTNCPFGICCNNCLFCNVEQENFQFLKITSSHQKTGSANENAFSNYVADCWHPPEIV